MCILIVLYDSTRGEKIYPGKLADYLEPTFRIETRLSGDFWIDRAQNITELSNELASIRVVDPLKKQLNPEPLPPEIDFERRRLSDPSVRSTGVLYDATRLMGIYWDNIPEEEKTRGTCHIVLTRELFGTWDPDDLRWHARVVALGYPCLVSTSGIIEGPARPRKFYTLMGSGVDINSIKEEMAFEIVDYGDDRIPEILKGYCAQAVFYALTGESFCDDAGCRLYNAHWQKDMIYAQIESPYEFCDAHLKKLEDLRREAERDGG